jgi:hypothetical protein
MSTQTRTPRPRPGDHLRPLVIRVTEDVYDVIVRTSVDEKVTQAEVVRHALDFWLREGGPW